jgi:aspartate/methionine/tyrosine aminotransferase
MSHRISERVAGMVRMTMADMADLADARPGAFRLENADAYLLPAAQVLEAMRAAVGSDRHNSYLPLRGLPELREAIALRLREDYGLEYDPDDEIIVTSGAGEAMLNCLLAFADPGDRVCLTNPTYSGMAQRTRLAGAVQSFADLDESSGWRLDPERFRAAAEGTRVIFYASPCMPTGTVFTREETEVIAAAARDEDAVLVYNGALEKMLYDGNRVTHPATLPGVRERTVTVSSVSKNYNMMGWRIGWVAGPRELVRPLEDVHIFNGLMPSGITQAGAAAALAGPQSWLDDNVAAHQRLRDALLEALAPVEGLRPVKPEGGYFFIARISEVGMSSAEFCRRLLEETDVALTPMVAWGADDFGYDHVRFIFTNEPEDRLREAAARIAEFVGGLGRS